ncbi:thermonuclease family protein [Pseudomonas sp. PDM14]|uniref:thermonuclease family protein n=1 Tax=Pseudomonas sp. PDM14 TaxID=2769288 RepID=UPI00177DD13A|nr:thermonuclease family protein [Pseudomonas sp. PDM14]MBD9482834.1 thermonuclease family protein [Pseudomonas sp. PDM14]
MGHSTLLKKASLVGAFFVSVFFTLPGWAFCPSAGALPQVRVERVVDGDTLRLADGRSVRLVGINAPERARDGRPAEPYAEAARKRLQALVVASDERVGLRLGERARDHYGRTLAHVYDGAGRNLEAMLLSEGLGYQVAFEDDALVACQRAAEVEARRGRLGLWRQVEVIASDAVQRGGFTLVSGRVERVQRNRGGLWLEMPGLVLRVEPKLLAQFDVAAIQRLVGQRVDARGWVVDRARRGGVKAHQARWMLSLTHPAMLEVSP